MKDRESREFWECVDRGAKEVEEWPEWKRKWADYFARGYYNDPWWGMQ